MSKQFDDFMKLKKAHELISEVQEDLNNDQVAKKIATDLTALMVVEYSFLKRPMMKAAKEILRFAELMPEEKESANE